MPRLKVVVRPGRISRSAQNGRMEILMSGLTRQAVPAEGQLLLNCRLPLELRLAPVYPSPYKKNGNGKATPVMQSSHCDPGTSVAPGTNVAPADSATTYSFRGAQPAPGLTPFSFSTSSLVTNASRSPAKWSCPGL